MASICPRCLLGMRLSNLRRKAGGYRALNSRQLPSPVRLQRRWASNPADRADFISVLDSPPLLVKTGRRHGPGLIILGMSTLPRQNSPLMIQALIPLTAFALGTWQVYRLDWKTKLIAKYEDRLVRDPLPLPLKIDPEAVKDFDYRRVYATGNLRHDQEMLIGPRMHDGQNGYLVVTPLERESDGSTVLVNRGCPGSTERALEE